jgi:hypothetical protein
MEFHGLLGDLDAYYLERRELELRSAALEAEIRRLGQEGGREDAIRQRRAELAANAARLRRLACLLDGIRALACMR